MCAYERENKRDVILCFANIQTDRERKIWKGKRKIEKEKDTLRQIEKGRERHRK